MAEIGPDMELTAAPNALLWPLALQHTTIHCHTRCKDKGNLGKALEGTASERVKYWWNNHWCQKLQLRIVDHLCKISFLKREKHPNRVV